jgi:peptidoglycan/xylan/chitin deacetylase (PgdA/CDA1 family)
MLERYGWPGYFFVATDWIGRPGCLNAARIRELDSRGHVIGSHSYSHPERMARQSWERLLAEWKASTEQLASILGYPVKVASVPGRILFTPRGGGRSGSGHRDIVYIRAHGWCADGKRVPRWDAIRCSARWGRNGPRALPRGSWGRACDRHCCGKPRDWRRLWADRFICSYARLY